jgi:hydrogen peroxide-dependent heme synthase
MSDNELRPSEGWGVIHLFLRTQRGADGTGLVETLTRFSATDPNQVITFSVLGGRADIGLMLLSPDLDALDRVVKEITAGPVECLDSFVSLTEQSEYTTTEAEERARLEAAGDPNLEETLATWRDRMAHYADHRLHPRLPSRRFICFYPMSKARIPGANWFDLSFDERKALMRGHAATGRSYSGRILQLITGATGLDDWEWGVTLLADDPVAVKEIVYEMRFDAASAKYALFGPFWVGLVMDPHAAMERAGLSV